MLFDKNPSKSQCDGFDHVLSYGYEYSPSGFSMQFLGKRLVKMTARSATNSKVVKDQIAVI